MKQGSKESKLIDCRSIVFHKRICLEVLFMGFFFLLLSLLATSLIFILSVVLILSVIPVISSSALSFFSSCLWSVSWCDYWAFYCFIFTLIAALLGILFTSVHSSIDVCVLSLSISSCGSSSNLACCRNVFLTCNLFLVKLEHIHSLI